MPGLFLLACLVLHFPVRAGGAFPTPSPAPPSPSWPPTYDSASSTLIMISNQTSGGGYWNNAVFNLTRWGIVDVDGGNAYQIWAKGKPMDAAAAQREQAARLKRANPAQKVWTYRNLIKLITYLPAVQDVVADAAYAPWFFPYRAPNATPYANPPCDATWAPPVCSPFFHDGAGWRPPVWAPSDCGDGPCDCGGARGVPCGAFYVDFRRWAGPPVRGVTLREWYLSAYIDVSLLLDGTFDGFFLDDVWTPLNGTSGGPSEAAPGWQQDTGLSAGEVADVSAAFWPALAEVKAAILAAGGLAWQSFVANATNQGPLVRRGDCAAALRALCAPGAAAHEGPLFYGFTAVHHNNFTNTSLPGFSEDFAAFMLIRGPWAWIGYPWVGVNAPYFAPDALWADYGAPLGLCRETAPNSSLFERRWSKARAQLDCGSWVGSVTPLPAPPLLLYALPHSIDMGNASLVLADPAGAPLLDATRIIFWRLGGGPLLPVGGWDLAPWTGGCSAPCPRAEQRGVGPVVRNGSSAAAFSEGEFRAVLNLFDTPVPPPASLGTIVIEYNWSPSTRVAPWPLDGSLLDLAVRVRTPSAAKTGVAVYSSWTIGLSHAATGAFVWWETAIFDFARPLGGDELWLDTISGNVIVHGVLGPASAFHSRSADSGVSGEAPWQEARLLHFTVSGAQVAGAMEAANAKFNLTLGTRARDWLLVHTNLEAEGLGGARMGHSVSGMAITSLP